ncbi:MAG: hypothetical protein MJE66_09920 [Proteobacteria bacterium]|nr:hypothetical protein [Pseudomonadota bacterium]
MTKDHRALDATSLLGIVVGVGALVPAALVPELSALALLGFVVLVPSLLFGMR